MLKKRKKLTDKGIVMNIFDVKNVEDIPKVVVDSLNKTRAKNKMTQKEYNHYYYLTKTKIKRQKDK